MTKIYGQNKGINVSFIFQSPVNLSLCTDKSYSVDICHDRLFHYFPSNFTPESNSNFVPFLGLSLDVGSNELRNSRVDIFRPIRSFKIDLFSSFKVTA